MRSSVGTTLYLPSRRTGAAGSVSGIRMECNGRYNQRTICREASASPDIAGAARAVRTDLVPRQAFVPLVEQRSAGDACLPEVEVRISPTLHHVIVVIEQLIVTCLAHAGE